MLLFGLSSGVKNLFVKENTRGSFWSFVENIWSFVEKPYDFSKNIW